MEVVRFLCLSVEAWVVGSCFGELLERDCGRAGKKINPVTELIERPNRVFLRHLEGLAGSGCLSSDFI